MINNREILETNYSRSTAILMKHLELLYPIIFKNTMILELRLNNPQFAHFCQNFKLTQNKVIVNDGSFQVSFICILKSLLPDYIILKENIFIYDGLLECDIVLENQKNNSKCIIELFGPTHYLNGNLEMFNVVSKNNLKLKNKFGRVFVINYFEWYYLSTLNHKNDYIKWKLDGFLNLNS